MRISVFVGNLDQAVYVLVLVLLTSCGSGREWAGCYTVDRSGWNWTREDMDSAQHEIPARIRLTMDTVRVVDDSIAHLAVEPPIHSYREAPGIWMQADPDSLHIGWSTGYTGAFVHLAAGADSLVGFVRAYSDERLSVPDPEADVVMHPVLCESEDPAQHWLPGSAPLALGLNRPPDRFALLGRFGKPATLSAIAWTFEEEQ